MRRALVLALALAGCGGGGETYVSIEVSAPAALPGLARVDLTSTFRGETRMRMLSPVSALPGSAAYPSPCGSVPLSASAVARAATGTALATGTGSDHVSRGETLALRVVRGAAPPVDGGMPDAEVTDGAPPDGPPTDGDPGSA